MTCVNEKTHATALGDRRPRVRTSLSRMTMIRSVTPETVGAIPLFAGIPRRHRKQIARWADEVQVPTGRTLIEEGSYAREFCLIVSGSAELRQNGRRIAHLGAGDSFGAAGLLDPGQTQAETIVTTSDTRLLVMGPREFSAMAWRFPAVAQQLEAAIGCVASREQVGRAAA